MLRVLQHLLLHKQALLQKDESSQASASPLSHHQTCTSKAAPHDTGKPHQCSGETCATPITAAAVNFCATETSDIFFPITRAAAMSPLRCHLPSAAQLPATPGRQNCRRMQRPWPRTHQFLGEGLIAVQGSPQLLQAAHEVLKARVLAQLVEQGGVAVHRAMETGHTIHIHVILPC